MFEMGCGTMWWGGLLSLAVLALLIWAVVTAINRNRGQGPSAGHPPQQESPLDILKKRLARGEISIEEFERMKKELG